jgi:hypothetical protein
LSPVNSHAHSTMPGILTRQALAPLREGFDTPRSGSDDGGLVGGASVLREYSAPWLPTVLGGWTAFTTLILIDQMRESITMAMARRANFNEYRQLVRGILIAVFGDARQVEAQRAAAWAAHDRLRGVGADGREWTANDPELTTRVYTILVHHLLAAQERLLGQLGADRRDDYCADAMRTVGHVFGDPDFLPDTYDRLSAGYAEIIAHDLTVRPETFAVFEASRALLVRGVPMTQLVTASAGLLDAEVADVFGIDRSVPVEFARLALVDLADADRFPVACPTRHVEADRSAGPATVDG